MRRASPPRSPRRRRRGGGREPREKKKPRLGERRFGAGRRAARARAATDRGARVTFHARLPHNECGVRAEPQRPVAVAGDALVSDPLGEAGPGRRLALPGHAGRWARSSRRLARSAAAGDEATLTGVLPRAPPVRKHTRESFLYGTHYAPGYVLLAARTTPSTTCVCRAARSTRRTVCSTGSPNPSTARCCRRRTSRSSYPSFSAVRGTSW